MAYSDKNVLMIILDAVRFDYFESNVWSFLSPYRDHIHFYKNMYSVSCWTVPSVCSMMTGLYPPSHKAHTGNKCHLDADVPFLFEIFKNKGYDLYYLSANLMMHDTFLSRIEGTKLLSRPNSSNEKLLEIGNDIIGSMKKNDDRKSFVYCHFMESHRPYAELDGCSLSPPVKTLNRGANWSEFYIGRKVLNEEDSVVFCKMYERAVIENIRSVLTLFQQIEDQLDDWRIIVAADHGECLGEEGFYDHAFQLLPCCTHIPMMIFDRDFPDYCEEEGLYSNRSIFDLAQGNQVDPEEVVYSFFVNPEWFIQSQNVYLLREARPDLFFPLMATIMLDSYEVHKLILNFPSVSSVSTSKREEEEIRAKLESMGYI